MPHSASAAWPRPPVSLGISAGKIAGASSSAAVRRISLYTPELNLLAETEASSASTPPVAYEYVWFNGTPLAMFNFRTNATSFSFTDHLGTPIVQTNAEAAVIWRAEYEPFGTINHMRAGTEADQPLRFPGQEAATGWMAEEETYNVFRWYRAGWGRYTQADPIGLGGGWNLYAYVAANPVAWIDPTGLQLYSPGPAPDGVSLPSCPASPWQFAGIGPIYSDTRTIWKQIKSIQKQVPVPVGMVPGIGSKTPSLKSTKCECVYQYAGMKRVFHRDEIWERVLSCECGPNSKQTKIVTQYWEVPLKEVILPHPVPTTKRPGLWNPNFNTCQCASP